MAVAVFDAGHGTGGVRRADRMTSECGETPRKSFSEFDESGRLKTGGIDCGCFSMTGYELSTYPVVYDGIEEGHLQSSSAKYTPGTEVYCSTLSGVR
jgi:hypothetical protein